MKYISLKCLVTVSPIIAGLILVVWNSIAYSGFGLASLKEHICQEGLCLFNIPVLNMFIWFTEGMVIMLVIIAITTLICRKVII